MLRLALGQIRIRPMAFAGLAVALFMSVTAITVFGSLFAAGITGPPATGNQPGLLLIGGAFGEIVVLVSLFVVANTFSFSVRQQHRELALLRVVAATPRQVRRLIRLQVLAVVAAVSIPGWLVGAIAARWLLHATMSRGLAPAGESVPANPLPMAVATVASMVIGLISAAIAARRISRIAPSAALAEAAADSSRTSWIRLLAGTAVLVGGAFFCVFITTQPASKAGGGTLLAAFILMAGAALLGPVLARAIVTVLVMPVRLASRRVGWLAGDNMRGYSHRLSSAVIPMILLVALSCTFLFVSATIAVISHQVTPGELSTVNSATDVWLRELELGVLVAFGGISTLNTLAALTADRRREFALLRLIGATRQQLARVLCVETLLTAAVGVASGTVIAVGVAAAFGQTLPGAPLPSVPGASFSLVIVGTVALTALGVLLTGAWATSGPATELAQSRDAG